MMIKNKARKLERKMLPHKRDDAIEKIKALSKCNSRH